MSKASGHGTEGPFGLYACVYIYICTYIRWIEEILRLLGSPQNPGNAGVGCT